MMQPAAPRWRLLSVVHAVALAAVVALAGVPGRGGSRPVLAAGHASPAPDAVARQPAKKTVGIVLYPDFEVLDVYGPLEMWAYVPEFRLVIIAEQAGPVRSYQGASTVAEYSFANAPPLDILMVPGGFGTRPQLVNPAMLAYIRDQHARTELTTSVCTGSWLLARAGILTGLRATTNKTFYAEGLAQDTRVLWQPKARWVEDGKVVTSSGVSAGTDMALGVVAKLFGKDRARRLARSLEYVWNEDPDNDPFAVEAPQAAEPPQKPTPEARDEWNRVYSTTAFGAMNDANAFLAEVVRGRTPGKALDIGMGQGRNSLHLARLGWDVTGVDISDEGVRHATAEAKKANLSVQAHRQDFATFDLGRAQWDLIAGIYMGDLITSNAARIVDALKPGGILVVENFQRDINRPGAVGGAPLGYAANELLTTFAALRVRRYEDTRAPADWGPKSAPVPVVRFVGEKR